MPRRVENDELEFDPKTLQPKPRKLQAATEKVSSKAKAKKPAASKDASGEAPTKAPKRVRKEGGARAAKAAREEQQDQPEAMEPPDLDSDMPPFHDDDGHGSHGYAPEGY